MRTDPVFVLAPGWRSGTTFLQRMLNHAKEPDGKPLMIWGEHGNYVYGLVGHLVGILDEFGHHWKDGSEQLQRFLAGDMMQWTGNMTPPEPSLREGMIQFMDRIFMHEDRRWGFKEVRYGERETRLLTHLFPRAKFLFPVRDPARTLYSYNKLGWMEVDQATFIRGWIERTTFFSRFASDHPDVARLVIVDRMDAARWQKHLEWLGLYCDGEKVRELVDTPVWKMAPHEIDLGRSKTVKEALIHLPRAERLFATLPT